jgi:hypothetical protein
MIRIPAGNLFASASSIGGACKFFQVGRRQLQEQGDSLLVVPLGDIMVTIQAAKFLKDASAELGFVACAAAAAAANFALRTDGSASPLFSECAVRRARHVGHVRKRTFRTSHNRWKPDFVRPRFF